ncbi:MAG: putative photosynthetic complex assembly protein PuhC [Pseudomonadota bacterium]|jgi:putative photosynthetic complex assembly protein
MRAQTTDAVIPRRALLGAGGALGLCVVTIAALRLTGFSPREADGPSVDQRSLRFDDRPDGGIDVIDAASGTVIDRVHGEQGFVRGTLRGLARERRRRGLGADVPLQLLARADGRLTLTDPATGQRIDLESFGPANAAVFARWLDRSLKPKEAP